MSAESAITDDTSATRANGLKKGFIGIVSVIFMAVANAAPITAMTGNVPIAVGFGNGLGAASRYLYALGREIPSRKVKTTIGSTHAKHGSPYIASSIQSAITLVIVLAFAFFIAVQVPDANGAPVDTPALIGTAAILLVQAICSAAVIWFFWVKKTHKES